MQRGKHEQGTTSIARMRLLEAADALLVPTLIWDGEQVVVHANSAFGVRFGRRLRESLLGRSRDDLAQLFQARRVGPQRTKRLRITFGGDAILVMPVQIAQCADEGWHAEAYVDVTQQGVLDAEYADRGAASVREALSSDVSGRLANLLTALVGVADAVDGLDPSSLRSAITEDLRSLVGLCAEVSATLHQPGPAIEEPDARCFDAVPMLSRVVGAHQAKGITISVQAPPSARVSCCPTTLERALYNAVQNSIDASMWATNQSVPYRILLALETDRVALRCRFAVHDSGPGFVPGLHREGFGLAMMRRFAKSVGGRVELGASMLGGASVSFDVPSCESSERACPGADEH